MSEVPRTLLARYCLDTSFFVDLWNEDGAFSRGVFVGIWEALQEGVSNGSILSPHAVRDELRDTDDAKQKAWVSENTSIFVPLDMAQVSALTEIVRKFPGYANEPRNLADPVVVALAKVDGLTVLSSENRVTQVGKNPKMPNVCEEFGITCLNIKSFCQEEGIKLTRSPLSTP